jgi:peptidyl-prolyl cis-trans isomerase SurA
MMIFIVLFCLHADQIAAFVNEEIILESDVQANIELLTSNPAAKAMFESEEEMRTAVLNDLIAEKLIVAEAERESINVTQEEIDPRVSLIIEDVKEQYSSEAEFFEILKSQGFTVEQLRNKYAQQIKTQLIMEKLIAKKSTGIVVSPIEVKDFYEENKDSIAKRPDRVKLAHIILSIRPNENTLRKTFEEAVEVYNLLMGGGDFKVMAQEFSDDPNSKYKGGMLGKIKRGDMVEEFEQFVFSLKPAEISQPFPTRFGYHIVEVLNKGPDWVLARHILVEVSIFKSDSLRYKNVGQKLVDLVKNGVDFDSLAKLYSDAPEIDIGEYYLNTLLSPIDSIVESLEQGELSEPMLTPVGYHMIYLREKIPGKTLSFEELRDQIAEYLYRQKLQARFDQIVNDLEETTFVKVFSSTQ